MLYDIPIDILRIISEYGAFSYVISNKLAYLFNTNIDKIYDFKSQLSNNLIKQGIKEEIVKKTKKIILAVLEKLRQKKYLDDYAFSAWWIENRSQFRPRGKRALEQELYQKGIKAPVIKQVLLNEFPTEKEEELAGSLAKKQVKKYKNIPQSCFRSFPYIDSGSRGDCHTNPGIFLSFWRPSAFGSRCFQCFHENIESGQNRIFIEFALITHVSLVCQNGKPLFQQEKTIFCNT